MTDEIERRTKMIAMQMKRMAALAAVVAVGAGGTAPLALASHHHARPHRGIPQHNGGDRDADNNGGPSDGDGMV
jgi:hypothetical protein